MSFFRVLFQHLRVAGPHRALWLGAPLLLYCWTVTGPFVSDDLHILLNAESYLAGESDELALYRFARTDAEWNALRHRGTIPWWLPESGRLDFLRPVTELSFLADVYLFGRNAVGYRIVSLLVFTVALLCVHWMFMQVSGDRLRAGLATFYFGVSQTAAPPVTWLCNRQDLLVVIGVTLAAGAYWRVQRQPGWKWVLLAAPAFAFGLFSKEIGIGLGGVIVAHELILRRKASTRWQRPLPAVLAASLLLITLTYLGYYAYSRPWIFDLTGGDGAPTQFGSRLPLALLLYASVWTAGFPVDVLDLATQAQTWAVAAAGGVLALVSAVSLRRSARGDRAALFYLLWLLMFTLPGLRALTTSTRTLCVPTIGWVYLLAGLLVPAREEDAVAPLLLRQWLHAANGIVSIGCAIGAVVFMTGSETAARQRARTVIASLDEPLAEGDTLILAEWESAVELICGVDRFEFMTGTPDIAGVFLTQQGTGARLERLDDHTLLVRAENGSLMGTPFHDLTLGSGWKPQVGLSFPMRGFEIRIAEVAPDDKVTALILRFDAPLGSSHLHFYPPDWQRVARGGAPREQSRDREGAVFVAERGPLPYGRGSEKP